MSPPVARRPKPNVNEIVWSAVARGAQTSVARRVTEQSSRGILYPSHLLKFADLGHGTVAEVLENPRRYENEPLADPREGTPYGRQTAIVRLRKDGTPWIDSFVHGGCKYSLYQDREVWHAGVVRILTTLPELNDSFGYLNARGTPNAYVSRSDTTI